MSSVRIAAIQHDIAWFDRAANYAALAPRIAAAAAGGARIVLLTETFATGFDFSDPAIAEPEGGPSSSFLVEQAAANGVWVGGSCAELRSAGDQSVGDAGAKDPKAEQGQGGEHDGHRALDIRLRAAEAPI